MNAVPSFEWTATDYEQRTPEQIIERRGGNCAELSSVLARLLKPTGIEHRWVAEINIQPESAEREKTALEMVKERGAYASVFGRRHNDHRWLEVRDDRTGEWQPADPSLGIIGLQRWLRTRMALTERQPPAVSAAASILDEMLVPIAVLLPAKKGQPAVDRSEAYLITGLGNMNGGRVQGWAGWDEWEHAVREIAPLAAAAFEGKANLHDHAELIDRLARIYGRLKAEATHH